MTPCGQPFRVTQGHWNRQTCYLWLASSDPYSNSLSLPVLSRFWDKQRFQSKIAKFSHYKSVFMPALSGFSRNFVTTLGSKKLGWYMPIPACEKIEDAHSFMCKTIKRYKLATRATHFWNQLPVSVVGLPSLQFFLSFLCSRREWKPCRRKYLAKFRCLSFTTLKQNVYIYYLN